MSIMLGKDSDGSEKALISDFASAKDLEGVIPWTGAPMQYYSPERLYNFSEITCAMDIWSFGCVIIEVTVLIAYLFVICSTHRYIAVRFLQGWTVAVQYIRGCHLLWSAPRTTPSSA